MSALYAVSAPSEDTVRLRQEHTRMFFNTEDLGEGVLIISEEAVSWMKNGSDQGMSFEYPHISVHAVAKDPSSFPRPCLYMMIDAAHEIERVSDDEDDVPPITEVRFVPDNEAAVEVLFKTLSDCQILHPDPEDSIGDEEESEEEEDNDEDDHVGGMANNGSTSDGDEDQYMDAN